MARNFRTPGMGGSLRPPLAPAMMNELDASPMQQAEKALKTSQPAIAKPPKMSMPRPRGKRNLFFGE